MTSILANAYECQTAHNKYIRFWRYSFSTLYKSCLNLYSITRIDSSKLRVMFEAFKYFLSLIERQQRAHNETDFPGKY